MGLGLRVLGVGVYVVQRLEEGHTGDAILLVFFQPPSYFAVAVLTGGFTVEA